MSPLHPARFLAPAALVAATLAPAMAGQQAQQYGTIFFKTNVGSFKILGVSDKPAEGKLTISFTGTLLINQKTLDDPKVTASGNLRKEYSNPKRLQEAYHGTGTLVIQGHYPSIQWFGRNMSAQWNGFGIARLVGEFDKDLNTGKYWYIQNTADVKDWGTQMLAITNPPKPDDFKQIPQARGATTSGGTTGK